MYPFGYNSFFNALMAWNSDRQIGAAHEQLCKDRRERTEITEIVRLFLVVALMMTDCIYMNDETHRDR